MARSKPEDVAGQIRWATFDGPGGPTAVNEFGIFAVDPEQKHRHAMRLALCGLPHEPDLVRFMCLRAGRGDVVQAGAYFGDFLPPLSRAVGPDGLVWSFEPNPRNFALAERTLALNALENVRLLPHALASEPAELSLAVEKDGKPLGGLSRVVESNPKGALKTDAPTAPVTAVRLDDTIPPERPVALIQLDIEGYERPALEGARGLIARHRPWIVVEMQPRTAKAMMAELFPDLPYRAVGRLYQNMIFACAAGPTGATV